MSAAAPAKSPHPRVHYARLGEVERQLLQGADIADKLDLPGGDRVKCLLVPHGAAGAGGHPAPAQDLLDRNAAEDLRCALQGGGRGGVSVSDQ